MDEVPYYKTRAFWSQVGLLVTAGIALLVAYGVISSESAPAWLAFGTIAVALIAQAVGGVVISNNDARVQVERYRAETAQAELAAQLEAAAVAGFEGETLTMSGGDLAIPITLEITARVGATNES